MAVQVDEEDLKLFIYKNNYALEPSDCATPIQSKDVLLDLVKEHAIEVFTRLDSTKQSYYKLMWENFTIDALFDYSFENVFQDAAAEMRDACRGIKFSEYIKSLFSSLNKKLREAEFSPGRKERLVVTDFVNMGMHETQEKTQAAAAL
jgi:ferric iron reductase protein FhuF